MRSGQSRTRQQYLGDLGEAEVYAEFLHLGASINYLTQSDSGWDLHLHLPSDSIDVEDASDLRAWDLSGRVAHVQVKKQTSTKSPGLKVSAVHGWITGTRSGVPTFLFVVDGQGNFRYATPKALADWIDLSSTPAEGESSTTKLSMFDYSRTKFRQVLQVWSRFPNALLYSGVIDDLVHGNGVVQPAAAIDLIAEVALGWLNSAGISYTGLEGDWDRYAGEFYAAADFPDLQNGGDEYQKFRQELEERQDFHNEIGLPVATYSLLPDTEASRNDALRMLRLIFKTAATELA
ncbi:hypothetical protein [Actinoplanes sp. NPDC049118]|uniref:hypothetical protein n=1 Tax=Actinoplanes sp. NPDC049118 TaxID=3155769 RepID=UPI0033D09C69